MKRMLWVLVVLFVVLCGVASAEATIVASGDCGADGDNVTWTLDSAGTLTISGEGEMADFSSKEEVSWYSCSSLIKTAFIQDGVTSIGSYAFDNCINLISVTIPEGVSFIQSGVFSDCSSLTNISIPDGVVSIGNRAFSGCSSLASISIPKSVVYIDQAAFYGCCSLTRISLPEGVTSIEGYTFSECTSLTSITIPDGVIFIGDCAFSGCSNLTSVSIPDGVTCIGGYAFNECSRLTGIDIPQGLTSIEWGTFYGCSNLTSVSIPEGVTTIGEFAFAKCFGLANIGIPESVASIGRKAFNICSGLTSVSIPQSLTSMDPAAFDGCALETVYMANDNAAMLPVVAMSPETTTILCRRDSDVALWAAENGYSCIYIDDASGDELLSITLPKDMRLAVGDSMTIVPALYPETVTAALQWQSSAPGIVSVEEGVLTVHAPGTVTITAFCGSISDQFVVTAYIAVESFELSAEELWLAIGESTQLVIESIQPEDSEASFAWFSDYVKVQYYEDFGLVIAYVRILNVDDNGCISAYTDEYGADYNVYVTVTTEKGISRSCLVHVCYPVTDIKFNPEQIFVPVGGTAQLYANVVTDVSGSEFTNHLVTFTSSDESIATVNADGIVNALRPGSVTITASSTSGVTAECAVTVYTVHKLVLPASLQTIKEEAFIGIVANTVVLPEGCKSIGARAFANSTTLVTIYMPDSVTDIADDAFTGSRNVVFDCASDNAAAEYARTHGIPYTID